MNTVTDSEGRVWRKYSIEFNSDDRLYSVSMWALSEMHAVLRLEDLKANGRIAGEIITGE